MSERRGNYSRNGQAGVSGIGSNGADGLDANNADSVGGDGNSAHGAAGENGSNDSPLLQGLSDFAMNFNDVNWTKEVSRLLDGILSSLQKTGKK